jgi:hypothetical protein
MATPQRRPHNEVVVPARLTDVSAASSVYVAAPTGGWLVRAYSCIQAAITGADCTWQVKINGTAIAGTGTITQSGSAAGDVDTIDYAVPTYVPEGALIEFASAGESSTTVACEFAAVLRV